jgi:hypothetical protein
MKAILVEPCIFKEKRNTTKEISAIITEFTNKPVARIGEIEKTVVAAK